MQMPPDNIKLSDTELPLQDRAWVEQELSPGESLLLVGKPATSLWKPGYAYRMFFATLWNGFLFGLIGGMVVTHLDAAEFLEHLLPLSLLFVFLLPFYLIGIGFIISPWWERENDRRTVYVLTTQRALVLRPSTFLRRPTCRQFPLADDMIKEVREHRNGRGDIILGYDEHHGKRGVSLLPVGFLYVENVRSWESRMRRHLPAAPPDTVVATDTAPQRPELGYAPLAVVLLFFAAIYLVRRFFLAESWPLTHGKDISSLILVVCISIVSVHTLVRWYRAHSAYKRHAANTPLQEPPKEK